MSYSPDIAIHPGRIVADAIDRAGLTHKNACLRMGISPKHLSQIINGDASITIETALLLEPVLGGSASFWINLENNYQENKSRLERLEKLKEEIPLSKKFPYNELANRNYVPVTNKDIERVENLVEFFAVSSLEYVEETEEVAFRITSSKTKGEAIAAWLRCGEIEARKQILPEYSESKLKEIAESLKFLSVKTPEVYSVELIRLLNEAGVALVYIPHFPGSGVNGAVRWINDTPVIQLSIFNKYSDIFWFTLYHEIAHILLHGKKNKFIEYDKKDSSLQKDKEEEADNYASKALIPSKEYEKFIKAEDFTRSSIITFAKSLKIHSGIVAGRLCYEKKLNWSNAESLRSRLTINS